MKNLAMTHGLLYVAAYGPGRLSLDGRFGLPVDEMDVGVEVQPAERTRKIG